MRESVREGRRSWVWALCFLPFLVLAVHAWGEGPGLTSGDYAQYYLHASALLHGRSYTDIGYIFTPYNQWLGPPAQPPGFPLTLVPIFAAVGPNEFAIQSLIVLSAVLFLGLAALRIARSDGPLAGAAVVLIVGVALESVHATSSALSDLGFAALVWGTVLAADRPGAWSGKRIALVTLLGLGALSYRNAGASLIPAMILFALVRREWRPLTPVLLWLLVGAVVALRLHVGASVLSAAPTTLSDFLHDARLSVERYAVGGISETLLYPFPSRLSNLVYHAVAAPLLIWGLLRSLWRERRTAMVAFFIAYLLMLLVVPVREERYLWPVLPIFALGFFDGIRALLSLRSAVDSLRREPLALAACAVVAVAATVTVLLRPPRDTLLQHPQVRTLFARIAHLPRSPAPRVVFMNPHVLTWRTGVAAMPTFCATTPEAMAELRRNRITHVVVGDLGVAPGLDRVLRRMVADSAQAFTPVYGDSVFTLLALRPAGTSDSRVEGPSPAAGHGAARSAPAPREKVTC
jgi:hypothetical protein